MTLRPYSARPARLLLQLFADVSMVLWIYAWYRVGRFVHDSLVSAAGVGYNVQSRAGAVAGNLRAAGESASSVPLVGDALGAPLRDAGGSFGELAGAGGTAGDRITALADPLGWVVALAPILAVGLVWFLARLRFARRAGAAAELATAPAGEQLLALRALATRPLHQLTSVSPDPVEAWRRGDPAVVAALARLELRTVGVPTRSRRIEPR